MATTLTTPNTSIAKAEKAYCDARAKGLGVKEATKISKKIEVVSHSRLDRAWYADPRNPNHVVPNDEYLGMTEPQKDAQVLIWRNEKFSWGQCAIMAGWETESAIQRRFERATGLAALGHRTGKGGRFAFGERDLYHGAHKGLGAELSREELRELRANPELLAEYMAASDEYKSKLATKIRGAKAKVKGQRKAKTA